ncbi:hypothetical protein SK128_007122, partial [Halocaridina rubra]
MESGKGTDAVAGLHGGCWESPATSSNTDNQFYIDSIKKIGARIARRIFKNNGITNW